MVCLWKLQVTLVCQSATGAGGDQPGRQVGQIGEDLEPSTVPTVCQALCDGYKDEQNPACRWQEPVLECGVAEGGLRCDRVTAWKVTGRECFTGEVTFAFSSS